MNKCTFLPLHLVSCRPSPKNLYFMLYRYFMLQWLFILGEPNKSLWFYGRTTEKQKHWIDHSIFCYLYGWSNVSCINQNAFWFRWLPNKKGRYSKVTFHTLVIVVWWLSYCTKTWEILNHKSHWLTLGHWLPLHQIHLTELFWQNLGKDAD